MIGRLLLRLSGYSRKRSVRLAELREVGEVVVSLTFRARIYSPLGLLLYPGLIYASFIIVWAFVLHKHPLSRSY
jgi:hypothetical protein